MIKNKKERQIIMNRPPSLKRLEELIPLSHDHHHGLWLSMKIRTGFKKGIAPSRIKKYTDWFFENHLLPHFELEEMYVFPILGGENELVRRALREHRKLCRLFYAQQEIERNLVLIEEKLVSHIRFEERVLFEEIQKVATQEELEKVAITHQATAADIVAIDSWEDRFWK